MPAYLRDLFGTFQVGAIHGRILTAWSAAGVAGPLIINGILDTQGKPGTLTASAYRPALFTMVGILAIGFVANLLVRPVPDRFHEPDRGPTSPVAKATVTEPVALGPQSTPAVPERVGGQTGRLWLSWLLVAVLLGYGIVQTAITAAKLFTG
ncbi:MFS transporter small subunit [Micromonospora parastrephiae]|uniref:MFS transporter small subunit n=1 Tax=Micromonospora parastrephiae TaxID=2806101 RepID=UPI001EE3FCAD|nr:hypothetical protein [Micromonospora parastrephiae]